MKKTIIIFLLILSVNFVYSRTYPIKNVQLCNSEKCKFSLPKIKNADYQKYRYNSLYRQVYTMLHSTTYFDGWDLGLGSHQGIDIASITGTPVQSIGDGEVIFAEKKGNWGLVITIKHKIDGKIIYSTYAHLSEILVETGQTIKEGETIGKVGSTGNSTGPHLHFQIEKNTDGNHPFFYRGCVGNIFDIVNEGRCQNQLYKYTIDPILFLEYDGNIPITNQVYNNINNYYTIDNTNTSNIQLSGYTGGPIPINQVFTTYISHKQNNNFGIVDGEIKINTNTGFINSIPNSISILNGGRKILFSPNKTGFTITQIKLDNNTFYYIPTYISPNTNFKNNLPKIKIISHFYKKDHYIGLIESKYFQNDSKIILAGTTNIKFDQQKSRNYKSNLQNRLFGVKLGSNIKITEPNTKKYHIFQFKKTDNQNYNIMLLQNNILSATYFER